MRAITFSQHHQSGAVEVHAAVVDVIRVLSGADATGPEPNLPRLSIHLVHPAHSPRASCDLILHLARGGVVEPEMIPAIALGHPDQLAGLVEPMQKLFAAVAEKSRALLVHHRLCLAGLGVHCNDAEDLVPALVVGKGEALGVAFPADREMPALRERIRKQSLAQWNGALREHIEQLRAWVGQLVTRLEIVVREDFRLQLVLGR